MRITARLVCALVLLGIGGGGLWYSQWHSNQPRRECLHTLERLESALKSQDAKALPDLVALPDAFKSRTAAENCELLTKALRNEISLEGIAHLKKQGKFGPKKGVFPGEAQGWAEKSGVPAERCVAFLDDRNGQRAEVVLVREGNGYRIIRCNNVKPCARKDLAHK